MEDATSDPIMVAANAISDEVFEESLADADTNLVPVFAAIPISK